MSKVDIANTIYSMLMMFVFHCRLGRINCNDIRQFLARSTRPCIDYRDVF